MTADFNIQPLTDKYLEDVSLIESESFSQPWTLNQFAEALRSGYIISTVAVSDGRAVGYIILYNIAGEGQITNIAVKSDYRRRGIARGLFDYIFELSKSLNISRLTLEVRVSNNSAINLYKSIGFTEDGIRPNFYEHPQEDALLMSKVL